MIDSQTKYEDRYDSTEYDTTTLYFTGPTDLLNGNYPEAESATISVEFPKEHREPAFATVMISPCKFDEETNGYGDYDWTDLDLPYEEIDKLFLLAQRAQKEHLSTLLKNASERSSKPDIHDFDRFSQKPSR